MDNLLQNRNFVLLTFAVCSILSILNVEPSSDTYLGCYNEFGGEEGFHRHTQSTLSTLDGCRKSCRQSQKVPYTFAGLWGGRFCYCTDWIRRNLTEQVNSSLCDAPCPGEQTKACGASSDDGFLFSVYSVCQQGLYGRNCTKQCNCKDNKHCTVRGNCPEDKCASGWKLNSTISNNYNLCSIDINECTEGTTHNCSHFCNNTEGSYKCSCPSGYELKERFTCKDINECDKTPSVCDQTCTNTKGSYICGCTVGFRLNTTNGFKCGDVDECADNHAKCTDVCTNTIGSYACSCRSGYELHRNGYTCNDIDECERGNHHCSQFCHNTDGSYNCSCPSGYELEGRFACEEDPSSLRLRLGILRLRLGISNGILSFIIIILVGIVVILLILLKRKQTEKAREEAVGLDVYSSLDMKTQSAEFEDQSESPYTAIIPPDQMPNDAYKNVEAI